MQTLLQKNRLTALLEQRNGYLVLACALAVLCLCMTLLCFYLGNRERIVVVPAVVDKTFWVNQQEVSPDYLTMMTTVFCNLKFNITPDNAEYQQIQLLRYVAPRFYGSFKNALVAEREKFTLEHVSTVFYPTDMKVNAKALTVIVTGDLVSHIGTTTAPAERVAYQWTYEYRNGHLAITDLTEVTPHV